MKEFILGTLLILAMFILMLVVFSILAVGLR